MLENIEINCHSSIKINSGELILYIDPFKIEKETHDADIIFVTHNHYDHYSQEDINKIIKEDTIIVASKTIENSLDGIQNFILVETNKKYQLQTEFNA